MKETCTILGVDAGSISLAAAEIDRGGAILSTRYFFHRGRISEALEELLSEYAGGRVGAIAATSSTPEIIRGAERVDSRVAFITAARRLHPGAGSVLVVGGEKFGVATFDENGAYLNYRSNSSCAAGTGSFLDQQARRLNMEIGEFAERACRNTGALPKIASRCAVFAKTDLIHAQQVGHSPEEICDGLCMGLARNIRDTLFSGGEPRVPVVFAGGVSKNAAVVKHLSSLLGTELVVDGHSHVFGALGAALFVLEEGRAAETAPIARPAERIIREKKERSYHYEPLRSAGDGYPDFAGRERYEFSTREARLAVPVEVDVYGEIAGTRRVYLGIDIGSTSTKAAVLSDAGEVLAGLYTRTSGRPVEATQNIFEALDDIAQRRCASFEFLGAATTGSGRKFIAGITGADLALDEITAHARAAVELDPGVDTIIEIGGQDAKFTTLRNGMVTFSIMNNVCAAGTGSFIEEQAKKLDCPLSEFSARASGARAPLSSDRCTVFMERDLNYYLNENYSVSEILASVLHSVRDNYLLKVSGQGRMGERIFFQGATAKNRALVAAFEQKLGKRIMVSKFCHLTGALGAALTLRDEGRTRTSFRGISLHRGAIPVRSETCDLCANHCKLSVAEVEGDTVAFGFLCGRDYGTKKFMRGKTAVPELLASRREAAEFKEGDDIPASPVIGIPAALHLAEDAPFWKKFFDELFIRTISSHSIKEPLRVGKELAGAEFCAPMAALHGHVRYLLGKADLVFMPVYLEEKQDDSALRRHYCYYTQYAPPVVSCAERPGDRERIIMPVVRGLAGRFPMKVELYRALKRAPGLDVSFMQVSRAWDRAVKFAEERTAKLRDIYRRGAGKGGDVEVVFLGRPYTVLSPSMNSSIPDIFARLGVRAWYQDMLGARGDGAGELRPLLEAIHWNYAAKILEAARTAALTDRLYPVLVTSFKCTPDSYVIEYFKNIMDSHGKPYLVLQLDEHDSSVGYETRIEAGVRSFRNHFASLREAPGGESLRAVNPGVTRDRDALAGRTLLLPNWDWVTGRLLEANLRGAGIDARLMIETADSIRRSLRLNTGQCLPLSAVTQCAEDYIAAHGLDPAKTALWLFNSSISCNVRMFPYYVKRLLEARELGEVAIYVGDITFLDMSVATAVDAYFAYMFGGLLRKAGCRMRPYEMVKGSVDAALAEALELIARAFEAGGSKEEAVRMAVELLKNVPVKRTARPRVAVFGDLYVRDNDVMNQGLVRLIEEHGGEVVTTPYSDYMNIIADPYIRKWVREGLWGGAAAAKALQLTVPLFAKKYFDMFNEVIQDPPHAAVDDWEEVLASLRVSVEHTGESMDNILKIFSLLRTYPDISLFVQTNPSYCCPALVTEAMAGEIERITGVPVVTIEYDGTGGPRNDDIIPYLKYLRKRPVAARSRAI